MPAPEAITRRCLCNALVCSSFRNKHFFLSVTLGSIEHKNVENKLFSVTLLWGWLLWQCFLADNTDLCLIQGVFLVQNIAWKWVCFKLGHVCITLAKQITAIPMASQRRAASPSCSIPRPPTCPTGGGTTAAARLGVEPSLSCSPLWRRPASLSPSSPCPALR